MPDSGGYGSAGARGADEPPRPQELACFGELLGCIYELAASAPEDGFQVEALRAAAEVLQFDSAVWGFGAMVDGLPQRHGVCLLHQPAQMVLDWELIKQHDTLYQAAFARQGETLVTTSEGVIDGPAFDPAIVAHARRYGVAHALATVCLDRLTGLFDAIAFYRSDAARPFSERERCFAQCLKPHLVRAWSMHRLHCLDLAGGTRPVQALALCDDQGVLHAAGDDFIGRLRAEWPLWTGPLLPAPLRQALQQRPFCGVHTAVHARRAGALWLLRALDPSRLDALTAREREVAQHLASAQDYREIARRLNLSPQTVRNHVRHIYAKVGVHHKVELAGLVRDADATAAVEARPDSVTSARGCPGTRG